MSWVDGVSLLLAVGLGVYLVYALLQPEKFQ
ncbi:MAG: K(+)-transporting ATPase subunit F [Steroidobacteraceae bacterium]